MEFHSLCSAIGWGGYISCVPWLGVGGVARLVGSKKRIEQKSEEYMILACPFLCLGRTLVCH